MSFDLTQCLSYTYKPRKTKIISHEALSQRQRDIRKRTAAQKERLNNIAILDFETDPFDKDATHESRCPSQLLPDEILHPFAACLYSDNFDPIVVWDEDFESFISKVYSEIERLPGRYTIFAHNGGKFDYMFLMARLRGNVAFKGRGIMAAKVGEHDLRDSFHIIPEKLANFQKDAFDYTKLRKERRSEFRDEIIRYMMNDCKYLLEIVKAFVAEFGLKLTIGQAAIANLRKEYDVDHISERQDEYLRQYYFGGRVECIAGKGLFSGRYLHYDVNSMYPSVMCDYTHPIGDHYTIRTKGDISKDTFFLKLSCVNHGAFVRRSKDEPIESEGRAADARTDAPTCGQFFVTIHEYKVALELDLIERVEIHEFVDCNRASDFRRFVEPLYRRRQETKNALAHADRCRRNGEKLSSRELAEYYDIKKTDTFLKLIQNNCYGKFAQNPRDYKEHYVTARDGVPLKEDGTRDERFGNRWAFACEDYCIWERPNPGKRYFNVGTAASITGAARAKLLRAIAGSHDPIYCDTDSLICRELRGEDFSDSKLGAWKLENEFDEVIICGKKTYAGRYAQEFIKLDSLGSPIEFKCRSKGANDLTWQDYIDMLAGEVIAWTNKGVTLTKHGEQYYMRRKIRATATNRRLPISARIREIASHG